ncbi:MAG: PASTA domain-containing protein [Microthrixaceae bacterium]
MEGARRGFGPDGAKLGWARGTVVVVVSLAAALFVTWLLGWSANLDPVGAILGRPAQVEVPELSGLAQPRAEADLESADLSSRIEYSASLTTPRGAVVSQDPVAGEEVDVGSTVVVVISQGVSRIEMPPAVGLPLEDVIGPLEEAGVDFEVQEVASETVAAGVVIEQFPDAGQRVTPADEVRFVVSTGPEPRAVLDVTGLSAQGAAYALGSAGFVVEPELRDSDSVPQGAVIGTEPGASTVRPRDSVVTVVVSAGPPPLVLPDLSGRSADSAVTELTRLGLVANVTGGGVSGGSVTSQAPAAGESIRPGEMVSVQVSGG